MRRPPPSSRAAALFGACALAACAAAAPVAQRLQVTTAAEWSDVAALQTAAAQAAGVSVRDVAGVAPRRFALTLECPDAAACADARRRLIASSLVVDVAEDARARATPPPPGTTR